MRSQADELQSAGVWRAVNQYQIRFNVAISMVVPLANQRMVMVTRFKRLIFRKSAHDGK